MITCEAMGGHDPTGVKCQRDAQHISGSSECGIYPSWFLLCSMQIFGSSVGFTILPGNVTFHMVDFLPYVIQVGFQHPTEWELAEEGNVGVFSHG